MTWKINGTDLDTATVQVTCEFQTVTRAETRRVQTALTLGGTGRLHVIGRDVPRYTFRFRFFGPAQARQQRLNFLRGLTDQAQFTLEAPPAPNETYFEGASKTVTLLPDGNAQDYEEGHQTRLLVRATKV